MYNGMIKFKCNDCKQQFTAADMELMATNLTAPQPCPHCNSIHTYPARLSFVGPVIYRHTWEKNEEK